MTKIIRFSGDYEVSLGLIVEFEKRLEGKKLIIDGRVGERDLLLMYGVEDQGVYDIYDYLNSDLDLYKALIEIEDDLDLIPSPYREDKADFGQEAIDRLLEDGNSYAYILVRSNNLLDQMDLGDVDNIIIGSGSLEGRSYYISDEKVENRLYSKRKISYAKAFEAYVSKEFYQPSLLGKIKEFLK